MAYHPEELIQELNRQAQELRLRALEMIYRRGQGHPGGALSAAEIIAVLYFHHLRIDASNPEWPGRDRFILSKGHACAILYPALVHLGYFPQEELETWGHLGGRLQAHPDRLKTPGIDMTTGLLGHGISVGIGLALAGRLKGLYYRTYVLLGDGECQSGVIWEGAMAAAKYRLSNLTAIVDYNRIQLDGPVEEIMSLEPFVEKWKSFRWAVREIDGHNMRQILNTLDEIEEIHGQPSVIIAQTTKGKGVSFMENKAEWHGKAPNEEQYLQAVAELRKSRCS